MNGFLKRKHSGSEYLAKLMEEVGEVAIETLKRPRSDERLDSELADVIAVAEHWRRKLGVKK